MPLLRMRNASFEGGGASAGPVTLDVYPGERMALAIGSAREASIVALMASGIVKPSHGSVFDRRLRPADSVVNCKRVAALVPHEPCGLSESEFVGTWSIVPHCGRSSRTARWRTLNCCVSAWAECTKPSPFR